MTETDFGIRAVIFGYQARAAAGTRGLGRDLPLDDHRRPNGNRPHMLCS